MVYYSKTDYKLVKYEKSSTKNKKYNAVLEHKKTKKIIKIPFGDIRYSNYHDLTGLNLYTTHNDKKRRALYRARHRKDVRPGYYSPGWFSFNMLW